MRHELSLISVAALAALGLGFGAQCAAAALPEVSGVELQPLAAQVKRVTEALDYLGAPLSPAKQQALVKGSVQQNVMFPWDAVPAGECTDHW